jgi:hypothetical protein
MLSARDNHDIFPYGLTLRSTRTPPAQPVSSLVFHHHLLRSHRLSGGVGYLLPLAFFVNISEVVWERQKLEK